MPDLIEVTIIDEDGNEKVIKVSDKLDMQTACTPGEEKCWNGNLLKCNSHGKWYDTGSSC